MLDGVAQVVIDEHIIEENAKPLLVYREQAKASAWSRCTCGGIAAAYRSASC